MSQPVAPSPVHSCCSILVHLYLAHIVKNLLLWGSRTSINSITSLYINRPPSSSIALELLRVHRLSSATSYMSSLVKYCIRIVLAVLLFSSSSSSSGSSSSGSSSSSSGSSSSSSIGTVSCYLYAWPVASSFPIAAVIVQ